MVTKETKLIKQTLGIEKKVPFVNDELFIPNHSGAGHSIQQGRENLGWNDQQVSLGAVRLGSSSPTWTEYKGSEVLAFSKSQENKIFFTCQLNHGWNPKTPIEFHAHVVHADADTGNSKWTLTYSWAKIGGTFPAETSTSVIHAAPASADMHNYLDVIEEITPPEDMGVSSILLCSLTRNGTDVEDTYDDDIYLIALDFHIQQNTWGSREETRK